MTGRAELAAIGLLALLAAGPVVPATAESTAAQPDAARPDPGFLEFLGMMVEDEGEWVDPLDMASVELPAEAARPLDKQADGRDERGDGYGEAVENDDDDH